MTITELSIKRPPLIIVVFTFLIVLGTFSYYSLSYELIPDIMPTMISVSTVYPGASPNEVESSVTKTIEESITDVEKIKRVTSTSYESVSLIFIEFLQSADPAIAVQDVQRKVNEVLVKLPDECKTPTVSKFSMNAMPVIKIAAVSGMDDRVFYQQMKENIKPRLARIEGVGMVTLFGGEEREIKINVDKKKLQSYGLSILQVLETVKRSNYDFPAGKVKAGETQYIVRVSGKLQSLDAIKNLVIKDSPEYGKVKIQDIAEVIDAAKETEEISRFNKQTALGIIIIKQNDANAVDVCAKVKKELKTIEQEYAGNKYKFTIAQDASVFTMDSANGVKFDLGFAVFLVGIIMLLFLHSLRNSIIVMVAIPCSLISTFIAIYIFGFTLNLLTLLALSLVIGILVDDSIVVLENIHRHLEMGKDRRRAAIDGRNEIGFTALSITLVDVVVYLPLALITGIMGNIVRQFSLVMVVSTLISLFVSFTITPMLAARYSRKDELNKSSLMGKFALWFERQFQLFSKLYVQALSWSLKHKAVVITAATVLLILSFALIPAGFIGSEFIPATDKGELTLTLELEPGAKFSENNAVSGKVEDMLLARPDVVSVFTNVGSSAEDFIGMSSNNFTDMTITLVPKNKRNRNINEIGAEIKKFAQQIPGVKARVAPVMFMGFSDVAPVAIGINGSNTSEVLATASQIESELKKIPGTGDVRKSVTSGKPEIQIHINKEKMASLGLSLDLVGAELQTALTGDNNSKFREGNYEYDINIMYDQFDKDNPSEVKNICFINSNGQKIFLNQFADIIYASGPTKLERKYQNNSITVSSRAVGRAPGDIGEDIKKVIDKMSIPAGIQITYENDLETQAEAFDSLGLAFMAAILFIYLILVALYNSFVYPLSVLLTIPLAVIGALLGLALTMNTLNIISLLGIIVLIGLVGKNAILLIDRTSQNRENGMDITEALIEAAKTRLRPILMTTATLVFGVLPIAVATGASNELKNGLAIVLIGGLISSLFLTLLLVPVMYTKVEQLKGFLLGIKFRLLSLFGSRKESPAQTGISSGTNSLFLLFAAASILCAGTLSAQQKSISIKDAVAIALQNNREIQISSLSILQSGEKTRETYGYLYPEIKAEGSYIRNTKLPVFYLPGEFFGITGGGSIPMEIGENNAYEGYLKFQMPLYNASIYPGIRAAKLEEKISCENSKSIRQKVVTDVKKAYLNVLLFNRQLILAEQSLKRAGQRLSDVKSLFKQGLTADVDTLTAYIGVENTRPVIFKLKNAVANSTDALKFVMGISKEDITLSDSLCLAEESLNEDLNQLIKNALANRPEIKILELGIEAADELKSVQFAGHLPTLTLFGQLKIEAQAGNYVMSQYQWPTSSLVGLQLSVPLFSGFKNDARVEQAVIEKDKAEIQLKNYHDYLAIEIKTSLANVHEAKKNLLLQAKTVTLAERNYSLVQSRFKNGIAKLSDLQDAELVLREAKTNYTNEIFNYLTAKCDFEKAAGSVSVE